MSAVGDWDAFLHLFTDGRDPSKHSVLSIAAAASPSTRPNFVNVFTCNVEHIAGRTPDTNVHKPLAKTPELFSALTDKALPPTSAMQRLVQWLRLLSGFVGSDPEGAAGRTWTGPLLVFTSPCGEPFLKEYLTLSLPSLSQADAEFAEVLLEALPTISTCARTSMVERLNTDHASLGGHPDYQRWYSSGPGPTGVPVNDVIVHGTAHINSTTSGTAAEPLQEVQAATFAKGCDRPARYGAALQRVDTLDDVIAALSLRRGTAQELPFAPYPAITSVRFMDTDPQMQALLGNPTVSSREWVATEKVHGANFSVIFGWEAGSARPVVVGFARRTDALKPGEQFNQYDAVIAPILPKLVRVAVAARGRNDSVQHVTIFGELAGGSYKHPAVYPCPGASRVQAGVEYAPGVFFYGFDIKLSCGDAAGAVSDTFVPVDQCITLFADAGIFSVKPLGRGPLPELLQSLSTTFATTIPQRLGVEHVIEGNHAEGLVLRPLADVYWSYETGTVKEGPGVDGEGTVAERLHLKAKHPKFEEYTKPTDNRQSKIRNGKDYVAAVTNALVSQRVANVASKCSLEDLRSDVDGFVTRVVSDAEAEVRSHIPNKIRRDVLRHKEVAEAEEQFQAAARALVMEYLKTSTS